MKIYSVNDKEFRAYGRVLDVDTADFVKAINNHEAVKEGVVYEPSVAEFEALPLSAIMKDKIYGEQPIEFGHCSGYNRKLNAVKYHRSSEVDIAATDLYLMLGKQQDIEPEKFTYATEQIEVFHVPAGTAVELYATTLHFAPCSIEPGKEFRCGVILPKHTNEALSKIDRQAGEDKLLFANNKWMIAHEDSGLGKDGAFVGLQGKNLEL